MRSIRTIILSLSLLIVVAASATPSSAEEGGGASEMACKNQDPLANIKAVQNENHISFNAGGDEKDNL